MKVFPHDSDAPTGENHPELDYWLLTFKNASTESSFQRSHKSIANPKPRFITFLLFQYLTILIYVATYFLQLQNSDFQNTLLCQLILTAICMLFISMLIYMYSQFNKFRSKHEWLVHTSYSTISLLLIFNDSWAQKVFFVATQPLDLNSLPGLIFISLLYLQCRIDNYRALILSNLVISTIYCIFRFYKDTFVVPAVLEAILLISTHLFQIATVYVRDYSRRKKYIKNRLLSTSETEKILADSESNQNNDYRLHENIEELTNILPLMQDNLKYPIEKAIGFLRTLAIDSRKRHSTDANLELITQGLDEQDRLYIQQSWSTPPIVQVRNRSKSTVRYSKINKFDNSLNPDAILMIKQISFNWNIDFFTFASRCEQSLMILIGSYCLKIYNVVESFKIPEEKINNFLMKLEKNYKRNPYHNSTHSVDVLNSYLFILNTSFISKSLTDIDMLVSIIAALAHDVGHPGFTNRFLINFQDKMALQCNSYLDNDNSVLENMHSSLTFSILSIPECNILNTLEVDQYLLVRKLIIEIILATDMGQHFELIGNFRNKRFTESDIDTQECRLDTFKMIMKASDIGHAAKCTELHMNWSLLISEEFFHQGDIEKESGKPISMYCDRSTTVLPKSQIGFLKNIALPLYEALNGFLNSAQIEAQCIEQIRSNITLWEQEYKIGGNRTLKENQIFRLMSEYHAYLSEDKSIGELVYSSSK